MATKFKIEKVAAWKVDGVLIEDNIAAKRAVIKMGLNDALAARFSNMDEKARAELAEFLSDTIEGIIRDAKEAMSWVPDASAENRI